MTNQKIQIIIDAEGDSYARMELVEAVERVAPYMFHNVIVHSTAEDF